MTSPGSERRVFPIWSCAALLTIAGVCYAAYLLAQKRPAGRGPTSEAQAPLPLRDSANPLRKIQNSSSAGKSPFRFESVAHQAGIDFTYYGSPSDKRYMTEQNGGGAGLLDFDADGRLDVFLVNGSSFDLPAETHGASHRLFQATDSWQYRDVTQSAGLEAFGFGMGCAVGDYDNDGFEDLFVANYGENRLWHNAGDGTFQEMTHIAGVGDPRWGTSAAFADLDGDGNLDLYVANYVEWSKDAPPCYTQNAERPVKISCGPLGRPGQTNMLYRNDGSGHFTDLSQSSGVAAVPGKSLDVVISDFDEDGRLDIYVANDTTENFLFRNLGQMHFDNVSLARGVAVNQSGTASSGMGIGCADYNQDGHFDLFVTNFENEVNDFYENLGTTGFVAKNSELGLDLQSRPMLGFGAALADFDGDARPDIFVANGHIWDLSPLGLGHSPAMRSQLFWNDRGERFVEMQQSGTYFQERRLARSVAVGDLDNDGDLDIVVTQLANPTVILRNDSRQVEASLRLRLIGTASARQPRGARVEVTAGGQTYVAQVSAGGGFQASSDDRLHVVVSNAKIIDRIRVHWSERHQEIFTMLPCDRPLVLIEGTGATER